MDGRAFPTEFPREGWIRVRRASGRRRTPDLGPEAPGLRGVHPTPDDKQPGPGHGPAAPYKAPARGVRDGQSVPAAPGRPDTADVQRPRQCWQHRKNQKDIHVF